MIISEIRFGSFVRHTNQSNKVMKLHLFFKFIVFWVTREITVRKIRKAHSVDCTVLVIHLWSWIVSWKNTNKYCHPNHLFHDFSCTWPHDIRLVKMAIFCSHYIWDHHKKRSVIKLSSETYGSSCRVIHWLSAGNSVEEDIVPWCIVLELTVNFHSWDNKSLFFIIQTCQLRLEGQTQLLYIAFFYILVIMHWFSGWPTDSSKLY